MYNKIIEKANKVANKSDIDIFYESCFDSWEDIFKIHKKIEMKHRKLINIEDVEDYRRYIKNMDENQLIQYIRIFKEIIYDMCK